MKKKITTVRFRTDGTLVRVNPDGQEEPLSVPPIPTKSEAEIEAAAAADTDNLPIAPQRRMRLRRVPRVKTLRRALGLTQEAFAERYAIPIGTLRDWEQGPTQPDQAARAYLDVIARDPTTTARLEHREKVNGTTGQGAAFQVGQRVYPKAASSLQGAVIEVRRRPQGGFCYKVFHSAELIREYDEEQLAANETS